MSEREHLQAEIEQKKHEREEQVRQIERSHVEREQQEAANIVQDRKELTAVAVRLGEMCNGVVLQSGDTLQVQAPDATGVPVTTVRAEREGHKTVPVLTVRSERDGFVVEATGITAKPFWCMSFDEIEKQVKGYVTNINSHKMDQIRLRTAS